MSILADMADSVRELSEEDQKILERETARMEAGALPVPIIFCEILLGKPMSCKDWIEFWSKHTGG